MDESRARHKLALLATLISCLLPAFSNGQSAYHETGIWAGKSFHVFGSHEIRDSVGFFYGSARPDRRLKHGDLKGHLVYEGYFEVNSDPGDREVLNPYQSGAAGALALARWSHRGFFFDLGIGLQAQSRISHDLPSVVNSTPTLGIGWFAWSGKKRLSIGVRYLHISNANTHRENAGQNQVLLYLSVFNF